MVLTLDLFNRVGDALFGPRWKSVLAESITCNNRLMRYYADGARQIPDEVWRKLAIVCRCRAAALIRMAEVIEGSLDRGAVPDSGTDRRIAA